MVWLFQIPPDKKSFGADATVMGIFFSCVGGILGLNVL